MDVMYAISKQKGGKAAGPDSIQMEAIINGGSRLKLYLSLLFNLSIRYSYLPTGFCSATIIPLVKCKSGNLSDVNNYRAIALSNSMTKILELLLFSLIESHDAADDFQFGF
jgi:hypothetical protein